jgi:molecular chaperone DnaK (HSP70)
MARPSHLIVVEIAERFRRSKGKDISRNSEALARLLEAVNGALLELQANDEVEIRVPSIAADRVGALHLHFTLSRNDAVEMGGVRSVEQLLD